MNVEFHINADAQDVRHCFTSSEPFRRHEGFTDKDSAAGWRQARSFDVAAEPDLGAAIARTEKEMLQQLRAFWEELASAGDLVLERVIYDGVHYTLDALGSGPGFGGQAFWVEWLAADREPVECNLYAQGRIPTWMRASLPDNARAIVDLGYSTRSTAVDHQDCDVPY